MPSALALLLCASVAAAEPAKAAAKPTDNLDFAAGTLSGWEGEGFYVTTAPGRGVGAAFGACSSDRGGKGHTALLHRTFVVPPGAGVLTCTACAVRAKDCEADDSLDVVLLAAGKRVIPKRVRSANGWQRVGHLLPRVNGRPRQYIWNVSDLVGQTLRVALIDEDKRAGCFLACGGFHVVPADVFDPHEFAAFMTHLAQEQHLSPMGRYDSDHFVALSNADPGFSELRLNNCELIYDCFYEHFRRKGFRLHRPPSKLMVAVFDTQGGWEAYLGQRMPEGVIGFYHPPSNRLVVYDIGANRDFKATKRRLKEASRAIGSDLDRQRFVSTLNRVSDDIRSGVNIMGIMHEVSHQLSFNSGMFNRDGDVPLWLAEGEATYCEATRDSAWQGIGEPNPERLNLLKALVDQKGALIPLRDLITSDEWLRKDPNLALLGYAESWALFKMLMEERTSAFRGYINFIYYRMTPDERLQDFTQFFSDLPRLELRLRDYIDDQVDQYRESQRPPGRR
ncbi:MAG TPA: DUF1570 domain-containing protein [Gemmataceae bacterium]|nr:DUF1570 domain-containing protein [Gemmataceae bacterium]